MPLVLNDSSTLIHLAAIGRLGLLRELYHKITIPAAVWREVVEEGGGRAGVREIETARQAAWAEIMSPVESVAIRVPLHCFPLVWRG